MIPPLREEYCRSSSTILLETVLQLLVEQLKKLSYSGFFAGDLKAYIELLSANVQALQDKLLEQGADVDLIAQIVASVWRATQFLAGTTSNKVPYEFTYLLREVLLDWKLSDTIVTTSLRQEPDFTCEPADEAPSVLLNELGMQELSKQGHLVQMGLPEIFQHMPLLCSPLYHEVGHYIEERYKFVTGLLISDYEKVLDAVPEVKVLSDKNQRDVAARAHMIEHFCDLVAASYVGHCVSDYIIQWDKTLSFRASHPLAESRAQTTRAFLEGSFDPVVDLLRGAVERASFKLERRFELPHVDACFNDVRPINVNSIRELHGLLPAADAFLGKILHPNLIRTGDSIHSVPREKRARLVNDLVEKSIRSFMITKAWNESVDQTATA